MASNRRNSAPRVPGQAAPATTDQPKQDDTPDTVNDGPQLAGSNTLDAVLDIAGRSVPLAKVVEFAYKDSGLSFDEWNSLEDAERDELLAAKIEQLADAFSLEALPIVATAPAPTATAKPAVVEETPLTHAVLTPEGWLVPEPKPKAKA